MPANQETRWCVRCGRELPADREHFASNSSHGLTFHCRDCSRKPHSAQQAREYVAVDGERKEWT